MRIALITTTINVPRVLELFQHHAVKAVHDVARLDAVHFFVAGDRRTPLAAAEFCAKYGNTTYIPYEAQHGWRCSSLIGPDCIQRRNIAFLEALKWGADVVVTWDDDNVPLSPDYFSTFASLMQLFWSGPKVGRGGWFDYGRWQFPHNAPSVSQRGMPYVEQDDHVGHVGAVAIGVAQGLCLGDPDTSAVDRLSQRPIVHQVSALLEAGVVVDPDTKTVFNSQNTSLVRDLVPAFFLAPVLGRNDDIYGSLICRRVMYARNLYLHVGKPFVYQQRNEHDVVRDLAAELYGMERVQEFAALLDEVEVPAGNGADQAEALWAAIDRSGLLPPQAVEAAFAFLEDARSVL